MSIIIFLYLMDNETSWLIILSSGFGIILDFWKIGKATKVSRKDTFPWIKFEDKNDYEETSTKKFDEVAITYMSYVLYPLLVIYAVYSLLYNDHKGWYSYIINTLVQAVYMFGFITMTPQLYINYKLKSVEHLPWRTLGYRFFNTIIDDLFSFIITMPTMHRLSCFRDDIIFFIYLYQRWIYKVDKNRDPYGELKKDDDASTVQEEKKEPIEAQVEAETEDEGTQNEPKDELINRKQEPKPSQPESVPESKKNK